MTGGVRSEGGTKGGSNLSLVLLQDDMPWKLGLGSLSKLSYDCLKD